MTQKSSDAATDGVKVKKKRVPGRPFEKGRSGNPGGRPGMSEDVKAARRMAYDDMIRTVIEVRLMTVKEAQKIDAKELPLGKRAIMAAYTKLNFKAITEYENRLFGRAPETIQLSTGDGTKEDADLLGCLLGRNRNTEGKKDDE